MSMSKFTLEEVAQHNTGNSCYIVIHNQVLDVTAWLKDHPGGPEVLLEQAGRIGSKAFEDVGHSKDARNLMKKYIVGELVGESREPSKGCCSNLSKPKKILAAGVAAAVLITGGVLIYRAVAK